MAIIEDASNNDTESDDEINEIENDSEVLLLGFAVEPDEAWSLYRQFFPSKIGGSPAWLDPRNLPENETQSLCDFCSAPLRFLVQVYAPIDDVESAFHRTLFLFTCVNQECLKQHLENQSEEHVNQKKSVKVFRSQLPRDNIFYSFDPPKSNEGPLTDGALLCSWCNTWKGGKVCGNCKKAGYCSKGHQVNHWKSGHSNVCNKERNLNSTQNSSDIPASVVWPELELKVEEEEDFLNDETFSEMRGSSQLLEEYEKRKEDEGDYNEEELAGLEEALQQENLLEKKHWAEFQAKLARAPDQVLRYSRGENTQPLWPSTKGQPKKSSIPLCSNCGSKRIFEFQVMSQVLYFLKVDSTFLDPLDFLTIAVYTCKDSCTSKDSKVAYLEELAWIQ